MTKKHFFSCMIILHVHVFILSTFLQDIWTNTYFFFRTSGLFHIFYRTSGLLPFFFRTPGLFHVLFRTSGLFPIFFRIPGLSIYLPFSGLSHFFFRTSGIQPFFPPDSRTLTFYPQSKLYFIIAISDTRAILSKVLSVLI